MPMRGRFKMRSMRLPMYMLAMTAQKTWGHLRRGKGPGGTPGTMGAARGGAETKWAGRPPDPRAHAPAAEDRPYGLLPILPGGKEILGDLQDGTRLLPPLDVIEN